MPLIFDSIILLLLFAVLGYSADRVVKHVKLMASALKIKLFAFGILLALVTSLPELALGINATIEGVSEIAMGNIMGGALVLFGLILGLSLAFSKDIKSTNDTQLTLAEVSVILLPILLGIDGRFSMLDGLFMILSYVGLIMFMYKKNHSFGVAHLDITNGQEMTKSVLTVILGTVIILICSHFIIEKTIDLFSYFNLSKVFIGVVIFSIGTNLPEITITIASWRKKATDLSVSLLTSAAFTNVLVLGILAVLKPIHFETDIIFWLVVIFRIIIVSVFALFYLSDQKMERREGIALFFIYLAFLLSNILIVQ